MAEPLTVKPVYEMLREYLRQRTDLGVGKAILDEWLEPASPFGSIGVRSPKRWFVLWSLLAAFGLASLVYFNRLW
jgi:hypothetical protein